MFIHKIKEFIVRTFTVKIDSNRIFGLDLLRFFSIAFVVVSHGLHYLPYTDFLLNFMLDGVTMFFVLSGFLIGGIVIEILNRNAFGRKELLNFWIRRWCRTLPAYFLVLLVLLILETFFIRDFSIYEGLKYFLFIQNFASPHPEFFAEAWSLSIEEWFYLLVPVFFIWINQYFKTKCKNICTYCYHFYYSFCDALQVVQVCKWCSSGFECVGSEF